MSVQLLDDNGNPINGSGKSKILDDNGNEIQNHPSAGIWDFVDSLDEGRKNFLQNHPVINRLLVGDKVDPNGYKVVGPEFPHIPGVAKGADWLADKIDNPQGEGGFYHGLAAGMVHGVGSILGGPLTPLPASGFGGNVTKSTDFNPDIIDANFKSENIPVSESVISSSPKQLGTGDINLPSEQSLPNLPHEFAPVDAEVAPDVKSTSIATKSPEESGYERILAKGGSESLEQIPPTWEHLDGDGNKIGDDNISNNKSNQPNIISDETGNPIKVYHGTVNKNININDLNPDSPNVRPSSAGIKGISFTSDQGYASGFTRIPGTKVGEQKGRILSGYISMGNPLDITDAIKNGQEQGLSFGDAKREALKSLTPEHDGVIFRGNDYNPDEYIVRSNKQIHSELPITQSVGDGSTSDNITKLSNPSAPEPEHQLLVPTQQPDTIHNQDGVQDGFKEPNFPNDVKVPDNEPSSPNDISTYDSQFNSMHKILNKYPETAGISKVLTDAADVKPRWLYGQFRQFENVSKGLSKSDRQTLGVLINHGTSDIAFNQTHNITPDMIDRANQAKSLFDDVHKFMLSMGVKGNQNTTDLGYLAQYLPHMERGPAGLVENIKNIWSHYLGRENPLYKVMFDTSSKVPMSDSIGDMFGKGTSTDPWSAFTMSRNDKMNPADIEWDYNKIVPAYLESVAKVAFDGPAVAKAEALLKQNADKMPPRVKEVAKAAITNFSGYEPNPVLNEHLNVLTRTIARKTAQSLISFNPGVHLLHAGEIPANIFPELGPKYTGIGIKELTTNAFSNYEEMARLGLLQDEVKPMSFKTIGEKIDSIGYYRSYVESLVKGIAYRGAKAKYLDMGMSSSEATRLAIKDAKDMTLTVDKSRQMMGLTSESKIVGGPFNRLAGQFKGIPLKFVEQQEDFLKALINNPKAAGPYIKVISALAGSAAAYEGGKEINRKLIHAVNPTDLATGAVMGPTASLFARMAQDVGLAAKAYKSGNNEQMKNYFLQSLVDGAAWLMPGGNMIKRNLPNSIVKPGSSNAGKNRPMRLKFTNARP
jgi:hypothetical protein